MRGQKGEPVQELSEMLNGMQLLAHWQEQLIHAMQEQLRRLRASRRRSTRPPVGGKPK